jgi:ribosomal protein S18 acetylase RimI-like enzyme
VNTRPLDASSWPDFAACVERNNGVWGGCWCMGFHAEQFTTPSNRDRKHERVCAGEAHAALVYDGDECVGWCQFGSPDELPRIKARRAYDAEPTERPDWRITCFFVDKATRRRGVAQAALAGALEQIATLGGGLVESFPEDTAGRKVSGSFLHNATLALFEAHGFERVRRLGKHRWLVTRQVPPG